MKPTKNPPARLARKPPPRPDVPAAMAAAPPAAVTSQYVVTINNATGLPVKIERLDPGTGKRQELDASAYAESATPSAGGAAAMSAGPAETNAIVSAYYQGVADYLAAITKPQEDRQSKK